MPPILTTFATYLFLVLGSISLGSLTLLGAWVPPRGKWPYRCAVWWSRALLLTGGVKLEVEREAELPSGPIVFVANHQSLYDIPVLLSTLPLPSRFLAKRSLFRIPFFGWGLVACGFVPVDRDDPLRAKRAVSLARAHLREGSSLMIFPEETRSPDGHILPFKRGGLLLAMLEQVPIVPIGIHGTREIKPKKGVWVHPGEVRVRYGRPLQPPARGRGSRSLTSVVREEVIRLSGLRPPPDQQERVPSSRAAAGVAKGLSTGESP